MIYGFIHPGSGLGNQLHRYVMTRILALDKGYKFGMIGIQNFKGKDFMNINFGEYPDPFPYISIEAGGRIANRSEIPSFEEWDKHCYDPGINFIEDNTIIDGNFEDERYFEHRLPEIRNWLDTEVVNVPSDVCIIGFRGGEYYSVPELGLPLEYFERGIKEMQEINPNMKFEVHTDDVELATKFFGNKFKIVHDISLNWRSIRWARYAIIANSSFYVLPRLLRHADFFEGFTIAPKYFNRYNTQKWDYPQFYYKKFKYI